MKHSVEKRQILSLKKIRQINYLVISLVKPLLSRDFCEKSVRENFCNFHTVTVALHNVEVYSHTFMAKIFVKSTVGWFHEKYFLGETSKIPVFYLKTTRNMDSSMNSELAKRSKWHFLTLSELISRKSCLSVFSYCTVRVSSANSQILSILSNSS